MTTSNKRQKICFTSYKPPILLLPSTHLLLVHPSSMPMPKLQISFAVPSNLLHNLPLLRQLPSLCQEYSHQLPSNQYRWLFLNFHPRFHFRGCPFYSPSLPLFQPFFAGAHVLLLIPFLLELPCIPILPSLSTMTLPLLARCLTLTSVRQKPLTPFSLVRTLPSGSNHYQMSGDDALKVSINLAPLTIPFLETTQLCSSSHIKSLLVAK